MKKAAFMVGVLFLILSLVTGSVHADQELYAPGHFPPGRIYTPYDLEGLIGRSFTEPTYLVGEFIYAGSHDGLYFFLATVPSFLKRDSIHPVENLVVSVKFFDNVPPTLAPGKTIVPTVDDPLTLKSVQASPDGKLLVVTEAWSTR